MKKLLAAGAAIFTLLPLSVGVAAAQSGSMKKIGPALTTLYQQHTSDAAAQAAPPAQSRAQASQPELVLARTTADGYVMLDVAAAGSTASLVNTLNSLGAREVASYGRLASAKFPIANLDELAASPDVHFASPSFVVTNVGLVTTQGDRSMRTDRARDRFRRTGRGLTVGILSDSIFCDPGPLNAAGVYTTPDEDVANGDLPPDINVLADFLDQTQCIDEGRGMAQLIYDVLPDSKLAFHTAFNGQADFAQGIIELALAGADVIVDDVIYVEEPMFQDGIIAQAADEVARLGVPYFSSNGNRARDAFEADYRSVSATIGTTAGRWHDFKAGSGVDLLKTVTLDGTLQTNISLQWDNPFFSVSGPPGAQTDVDLVMFDSAGVRVADCFPGGGPLVVPPNGLCQFIFTDGGVPIDGGAGGDAVEFVSLVDFVGGSTVQLGLLTESGPAPKFVKYVIFAGGYAATEYPVDAPSGYGHNNAAGAEGVGAAAFFFTEEFIGDPFTLQVRALAGEPECRPACLNDFSSAGGTPILFNTNGKRLKKPEVRLKPGITGPDGGNTSFFISDTGRDDDDMDGVFQSGEPGEFPNFFGTSAAAPHVASVAGLMIDLEGSEVLERKPNGAIEYNMCRTRHGERSRGRDIRVSPNEVQAQINGGALLGPCDRTEPHEIYDVMRDTAQNMRVRAVLNTGATIGTFREVGPSGFDFDSGFGFIDADRALREFEHRLRRHHDDDRRDRD